MKKVIIGVLITFCLILIGGSGFLVDFALCNNKSGQNTVESMSFIKKKYPYVGTWVDSLRNCKALKDTFILSTDKKKLHAYYVTASKPTNKTAVIVHGYTDNAIRMFMIGHLYNKELGYNVLLPDLRFTGKSEGSHIQMGWLDRLDVIRWMEVANQRFGGQTQMVVHGISMGAATIMMVSGEVLPPYVKCFVEDCGYTSVWDQFTKELKEDYGLPAFPLLYTASWYCQLKFGWNFHEASALKQVERCEFPMFFIHGDSDKYVPTVMAYKLYKIKPAPKELWITQKTKHADSYINYTKAYTQKIGTFTDKYIK